MPPLPTEIKFNFASSAEVVYAPLERKMEV
jgi:hypothetical protein